jgi:hypothetical protein
VKQVLGVAQENTYTEAGRRVIADSDRMPEFFVLPQNKRPVLRYSLEEIDLRLLEFVNPEDPDGPKLKFGPQ